MDVGGGPRRSNTILDLTFDRPYLVREGAFPAEELRRLFPMLVEDPAAYQQALDGRPALTGMETPA